MSAFSVVNLVRDIVQPLYTLPLRLADDQIQTALSDGGGGGGDPVWLPDGATSFFDFVNGHYFTDGSEVAAADVLSDISQIGVGGLTLTLSVDLIGDARDAFLGLNWTVVTEVIMNDDQLILVVRDDSDSKECGMSTQRRPTFEDFQGFNAVLYEYSNNGDRDTAGTLADSYFPKDPGVGRIAYTRTDAKISISANGAATQTDVAAGANDMDGMTQVWLGSYQAGHDGYGTVIRSITVYPPLDDAALPALSALS